MYLVPMYSSTFATWTVAKFWYIFHPNFGILLCVPWYIGTLVHWTLCTLGTLVHLYPGTLSCTMYPCTPPLLLLGLSQNFGTSFTPTLGFYYVYPGTLVHWYIGHCVPWVHCFWYIGTSLL